MANTSQILAKLGIDSSAVPAELAEADKFFKKFAAEAEKAAGTKAGASSGSKFMEAFQKRFSGAGLFSTLSTALGLNLSNIAEKVAEAFQEKFGGGTAKAFEKAGKVADEVAKKQSEVYFERLSTAQKIEKLENEISKSIAKQNELAQIGTALSADQLKQVQQAKLDQLNAEKTLADIRKQDRQASEEFAKKSAEADRQRLTKEEQIAQLNREILAIGVQVANSKDSAGEKDKKRLEMLDKQKEIEQLTKDLAEEKQKAEEKITKEKERQLDLDDKILKTNRQLRNAKEDLSEKKGSLEDRSKLTVAELAKLPAAQRQIEIESARDEARRREAFAFGSTAGLTQDQRDAKEQAQKILDLEAEAEAARVGGDKAKAEDLFAQVGQLRENLVASGAVKSTEGDPQKELLKEVRRQTEGIEDLVKQVQDLTTAKFKNQ